MKSFESQEETTKPISIRELEETGLLATSIAATVLIDIAKTALSVEATKAAYLASRWLGGRDNPLFHPYKEAIDAFKAALAKVRP